MDLVEIANLLRMTGPWGIVVALLGIIAILWRELLHERKRRDADNQGFALAQIQNVRDANERESRFADVLRMAFNRRGAE